MAIGTCKLSLTQGKLVKSHLIPKAFTRPEEPGLPLIQGGSGRLAVRRWDSWYDTGLVTRHGESILERYDTWAVAYLRRERLVWGGWEKQTELGQSHTKFEGTPWGFRRVVVAEPRMLRLFFLSLLWRAAATDLMEFSEVAMPPDHLERLRRMILAEDPGPINFYPVSLTQLSTRGVVHNMTPLAQIKHQPTWNSVPAREIPIFRFYFDGLIAHFTRQEDDDGWAESLGNIMVGAKDALLVSTVTNEASFEHENLGLVMSKTTWR